MAQPPKDKTIRQEPGTNITHVGQRWWDAGQVIEWCSLCGCYGSREDLFSDGLPVDTVLTCLTCIVYSRGFI